MSSDQRVLPTLRLDKYFRWRGRDVSRVEGFSDAAFAFAITFLVFSSSSELRTFADLDESMKAFLPFGVTFALLCMVWGDHYLFFRRYGIRDGFTVFLNCALLFVVMFYVFPLKFLFTALSLVVLGGQSDPTITIGGLSLHDMVGGGGSWPLEQVMYCYNAGFGTIYLLFALMYFNAWRKRDVLELDAVERRMTRNGLEACLIYVGFAVISTIVTVVAAYAEVRSLRAAAGLLYAGLGPVMGIHGWRRGVLVEKLVAQRPAEE